MKGTLSPHLRKQLERAIAVAREVAETGAHAALEALAVSQPEAFEHMGAEERKVRRRLRAHGRQLGDRRDPISGVQGIERLVHECAYEHWHGMLFARFLAENHLLIEPETGVAVTLEECEELGKEMGIDQWTMAANFAHEMLPQVFRPAHPVFEVQLAREHRLKLEGLVENVPADVFLAGDSLGWVYQFWQSRKKDEVNRSGSKIGADELPAVTQLFTEPYMVNFLLDNSLGAWWAAHRLSESDLSDVGSEVDLRRKAAIPGVPLEHLRFVRHLLPPVQGDLPRSGQSHPSPRGRGAGGEGKRVPIPAQILEYARSLRGGQTDAEQLLWGLLRSRRFAGKKFRRQHPIGRYILDFYCHECKLAVELDGGQHNDGEAKLRDDRRSEFLDEQGIRVVRFWNHDVLQQTESVLESLWQDVHAGSCSSSPSPQTPLPGGEVLTSATTLGGEVLSSAASPGGEGTSSTSTEGAGIMAAEEGLTWAPAAGPFDGWQEDLGELKVIDPCCGSGHFLIAAFSMLVPMRMVREGLSAREAVDAVLRENLYGLELDPRCVELAAFALALAAWTYPDAGRYRPLPALNLACSGLSIGTTKDRWTELAAGRRNLRIALDWLYDEFRDAPVLGSLLNPAKSNAARLMDFPTLATASGEALAHDESDERHEAAVAAQGLAKAAELLSGRYHLVATNVPYLARGKQSEKLRRFCEQHYFSAKNDLATVFLERCLELCVEGGTTSVVLPQNWLFLTSYKKLREKLLKTETWHLLARLGPGAFETISGEVVKAILLTLSRNHPTCRPDSLLVDEAIVGTLHQGHPTLMRVKAPLPPGEGFGVREPGAAVHRSAEPSSLAPLPRPLSQRERGDSGRPERMFTLEEPCTMYGLDVSESCTATEKAARLREAAIQSTEQTRQLMNPDARVTLEEQSGELLVKHVASYQGIKTGDDAAKRRRFWEPPGSGRWTYCQSTVVGSVFYGGMDSVLDWERNGIDMARLQGVGAWRRRGVAVSQMREVPVAIFQGYTFDSNVSAMPVRKESELPAVWCFCSSPEYNEAIRSIDQSLKVTNATLAKVPFDIDRWTKVAEERYPNGLPRPYTDDPTQWIFHGHPCGSVVWNEMEKWTSHGPMRTDTSVLHVAMARLLGYQWPAEQDAEMELADEQREWVLRSEELLGFADEDGIVCIPSVRGEPPAGQRLLELLAAAYGAAWNEGVLAKLLDEAGGKGLDDWLRNRFFEQHCKLFHHRPFVWHIWDGRKRDGFHALVSYHKLTEGDDKGRRLLESLTFSYLGDWMVRQQDGVQRDEVGAADRLASAKELQQRLFAIIEGEPPFDIFVRWKPVHEQPIRWEPDINDGVRLNIRPFMAEDIPGGKKGAGILRAKPNVHWRKDRGKEPLTRGRRSKPPWLQDEDSDPDLDDEEELRPQQDYPWFWPDDEFTGERRNDIHLPIAVKFAHRSMARQDDQ